MNTVSAPLTLATAPKAVAQPSGATVTFRFTESEAEKCGLGERWRSVMEKRRRKLALRQATQDRLNQSLVALILLAQSNKWSQRQLAARIGIPETSFRRIRDQLVEPSAWLPKVRAALARLNHDQNEN